MKFTLIVCTYRRPDSLMRLLVSVAGQILYPDQILIIDGSPDNRTKEMLELHPGKNLEYFKVEEEDRGLTRQRNFGIRKTALTSEIICFLDDDIVLTPQYFKNLINTYNRFPDAIGVGGYIIEEVNWQKTGAVQHEDSKFVFDGWMRDLGSRNVLRRKLGLLSDKPPGYMPDFSNGFSTGFLPPTGKVYPVEFFMGGVASYKKEVFSKISFSNYFIGYGLYEDMDFCLRASQLGQLYVNTEGQLYHHHEASGRPNRFRYGKMVIRNGWYVWKVKYKETSLQARFKWHSIALVLSIVRLMNILTTREKKAAFTEGIGRIVGWWSLVWNPPKIQR
ncbi:glycosyltransferase family 2 protein [Salinimicrobium sediminilitoris]|uniref:glycosyltransferase family 2 protein n=1 Tax=Salinimicrobium sediminilitoris TaxID=2876715 RepID=UPI002107022E|nr:glycosyltransferase [Salinimicrobium sediminilitoris]MCC8358539.1 glycosyltransferase [Salinimicrobium sediminilitoris]